MNFGQALRLGRGEGVGGGRKRQALLCATFEAVVGALFLDGGLEAVQRFVGPLLQPAVDQILSTNQDQDAKSLLQERIQALGYGPPAYRTVSTSGPEHMKSFEVEALIDGQPYTSGVGLSKQAAAKAAARAALERIEMEGLVSKETNAVTLEIT